MIKVLKVLEGVGVALTFFAGIIFAGAILVGSVLFVKETYYRYKLNYCISVATPADQHYCIRGYAGGTNANVDVNDRQ